jgi:branched-subunit amino acid aminotransferase/4-amino-4-deoxychorismate lyase
VIWHRGKIVGEDALTLSVHDRTLEHGLGLFETLRTWNGHPTLLPRHRERMLRSAGELGLPIDPADFPDIQAVTALIKPKSESQQRGTLTDYRLRITSSGGSADAAPRATQLWMTVSPLPAPLPKSGAVINHLIQVTDDDPLAHHKTLNYWRKRIAYDKAVVEGSDDALCVTSSGLAWETTRANLFVVIGGNVWTPRADGPLLPGIMRRLVLEHAALLGLKTREHPLPLVQLGVAKEAFLTNSVRGVAPIARIMDHKFPAPGPITRQLWGAILPWLESGGTT